MRYYPIFLDVAGRPCVVIGGGSVAERKVLGLLNAGAGVTVISPRVTSRLRELARAEKIIHLGRVYTSSDLRGYELAFVAANPEVAAAVFRDGRARRVWINAADDAVHCDFTLPSVLRRGRLTVAVSTGGASPAVSRAVREELEKCLPPDYGVLLEIAAEVREELRKTGQGVDARTWHKALQGEVRQFAFQGERDKAKARLLDALRRTR